MKPPKISIGLPVYNGQVYLGGAIQSILEQSYRDFELIISDNASTDGSEEICRKYAAQDPRIRYFRNEKNIGAAPNHNRVFELSTGEFFKWAAHDDLYPKQMLERCIEVLEKAPESVSLVYSQAEMINESGVSLGIKSDPVEKRDPRPSARLAQLLLNIREYNATYGLMRSKFVRQTRLEGSFPYSDKVFLAELALLGELWEIREPLLYLRAHAGRSTFANTNPDALREWYDPVEAKKAAVVPLKTRADLEIVRSVWRLRLPLGERILCFAVALALPCWFGLREWTYPLRKKLGLAPSIWRSKNDGLRPADR
jgi:glycosyltransferase involved in cell wall biosynthesis